MKNSPQTPPTTEDIPDLFTITDLETLKAVSTPFRQNLMKLMAEKPRTVKEMARELDMPPSRLYYHVNQLEKYGIIRVVKTQLVSGILEKHYQISARNFRVARSLLAPGSKDEAAAMAAVIQGTFEAAEEEMQRGLRTGVIDMTKAVPEPGATFIGHALAHLTPEQYADFLQRLSDLFVEFEAISGYENDPDAQLSALFVAIYPTEPASDPE